MYQEKLSELFQRCISANYVHVEHDGDYAIERQNDTLYLLLECSNGGADWANNFKFLAKPYRKPYSDMAEPWRCHRGFLKVWKSIEPYVQEDLLDPTVKHIIIVGYSHGAALAGIAHEYVWFNRPDLRENLESYGFGAPRFFGGYVISEGLKNRWKHFHPIRNINDIVTHLPPVIFGYRHANKIITIGKKGKYNCIDAHRPENILQELEELENEQENNV